MSKALLYHERTSSGDWKPVGVFFATPKRLDQKVLPGSARRSTWAESVASGAKPPYKDGIGISLERGTYEDWIDYALDSLSNGHDTWMTLIPPEPTLDATYRKWVLGDKGVQLSPPGITPTTEVPELSGYKKARPQ